MVLLNHWRYLPITYRSHSWGLPLECQLHTKCSVNIPRIANAGGSSPGPGAEQICSDSGSWHGEESSYSRTPLRRTMGLSGRMDEDVALVRS